MMMEDPFATIMRRQDDLLQKSGLDQVDFGHYNDIIELLEDKLDKAIYLSNKSMSIKRFSLSMTGLTEKMQKVSFRLRYEYDPEKQDLRIRTLLLKAAGVSRTFFINKNQVLPEADKVIAEIVREGQRKRARLIFQRAASRKVHPPTLRKAF